MKADLNKGVVGQEVTVFGPASLSNLGPGFDALGMCLEGIGDLITATVCDTPGINISFEEGPFGEGISTNPLKNTAGVAAMSVLKALGFEVGISLKIEKGFKPGSGIGSSAASAVGAAYAVNEVLGGHLSKKQLVDAVLTGEAVASGARHGDNVIPALVGGLVLVSSANPTTYRKLTVPPGLWLSVILPEVQVLTKVAREMLPESVPLKKTINQASGLAFMVDAFGAGDWEEVGYWMMQDQVAEPVRATLVPCYHQIKTAALDAGAYGCALTGSGPAMFAISNSKSAARAICDSMQSASHQAGVKASTYLSRVNDAGVSRANASVTLM